MLTTTLALTLCLCAAHEPAAPALLFTLDWGDGPILDPGGPEQKARGPTAVALGPSNEIWILDDLGHRILVYDRAGSLLNRIELPARHFDDLAVAGDGSFALLASHLSRIELFDAHGVATTELSLEPHLVLTQRIAFDAAGSLWTLDAFGNRFELGRPEAPHPSRDVMLGRRRGPIGSTFECATVVENGRAQLLRWPETAGPTTRRGPTPSREPLPLANVAAVRLASACSGQGLFLAVERLTTEVPLRATRELVRLDNDLRARGVWRGAEAALYSPRGRVGQGSEELVWIHPAAGGLEVWRWGLP